MKKSSIFIISLALLISCFIIFPITTSAEVTQDQYEYTDGILHLKYGDFDADFFRNFAERSSVSEIIADDGVCFVGSFGGDWNNRVFRSYSSCTSMDFSNVDTSNVTDMSYMFYVCSSLTSLDVSGFDTSNVTSMGGMFSGCSSLTSLALPDGFSVKSNMGLSNGNFGWAKAGTYTVVSGSGSDAVFISEGGEYVKYVISEDQYEYSDGVLHLKYGDFYADFFRKFTERSSVKEITADDGVSFFGSFGGDWNNRVFRSYSSCTSMDFSNVDTSNVTDMNYMFNGCSSITSLDVSGFDTSKVTSMYDMFNGCSSLTSLDVSCFDTSNVSNMGYMFSGCSSLTSLDVSGFDTSKVSNMSGMFSRCSSLTSLDLSGFNTSNVTYMHDMFLDCSSLTSLDVSGFDTSNVTDMRDMFNNCSSLTSLDLSGFDTSNVTSMDWMFSGCSSLTSLDLSGFDTSNVTDMGYMFFDCPSLSSLVLPVGFNVISDVCLNNGMDNLGWTKAGSDENISGAGQYAEFVSEGGEYVWLTEESVILPGDVNGDGDVTSDDAIHLLYYTFLPDQFPVNQNCDFDGNGAVDSDDAIYLLYYTFLPDMFPLN